MGRARGRPDVLQPCRRSKKCKELADVILQRSVSARAVLRQQRLRTLNSEASVTSSTTPGARLGLREWSPPRNEARHFFCFRSPRLEGCEEAFRVRDSGTRGRAGAGKVWAACRDLLSLLGRARMVVAAGLGQKSSARPPSVSVSQLRDKPGGNCRRQVFCKYDMSN